MKSSLWVQALTSMPKLSPPEWQALNPLLRWLVATRASVLFMTLMSAVLGGILAAYDGGFHWLPWLMCTLGLVMAHATNNLLNDFTDSRRGIDRDNYYRNQYGVHVLEDGLLSMARFWVYVVLTATLAILPGLYLVAVAGDATLQLMLAGAFFVLFYTWPLKYYGLGEPAVLLVWGPLMIGGTYYVVTGNWSWPVTWLSLLYACGPTSVLFGKHIDKLEMDAAKGVRTMPVLLGEARARYWVCAMLMVQYLGTVALVLLGIWHWGLLLVLLNLNHFKTLLQVFSAAKPAQAPAELPAGVWPLWFSAYAFAHTRRFTGLFLLGLLVQSVF